MTIVIILAAVSALMSLAAFVLPKEGNRWLAVSALLSAAVFCVVGWGENSSWFGGLYQVDALSRSLTLVSILGGIWTLFAGPAKKFEYPLLVVYAVTGMHMMASTSNLPLMLVALEVFSLPLYVLATWQRDTRGFEAGLKYFLLGAIAAAFFLFGTALYYGETSSFTAGAPVGGALGITGLLLILVALGFKISLAPFQWWTPDVYQGSSSVSTLFMSTAVKGAAFAALLRIFVPTDAPLWGTVLAVLIGATTIFGNLGALAQTEAKRLFAYSSIAHAGYMALGLYGDEGRAAIPFYLLSYGLATGAIMWILATLSNQDVPLQRLQGLFSRRPVQAAVMAVALLSLLGIPPLAGFWGKFMVFSQAAKAGYYPLAVVALLTSAVSAYYYLKVFFSLFGKPTEEAIALDQAGDAALAKFGSSESMKNIDLAGVAQDESTALMAPADRKGVGALWMWLAMALLALLSLMPKLVYNNLKLDIKPAVAAKPFDVVFPPQDAVLPIKGVLLGGLGTPGQSVVISEQGKVLSEVMVDANGAWKAPVDAALGRHTLEVASAGETKTRTVDVYEPKGEFGFAAPIASDIVAANGFNLTGYGLPGTELEIFEDGSSLGRVQVSEFNTWKIGVPPADKAGKHTYEIRSAGKPSVKLELEVAAAAEGAVCNTPFSLSNMSGGGKVSKPFRFGGVGTADSYTVTIKRGDRVIGTKNIKRSAACGWSYFSNPGKGTVTYEVRETATPDQQPLSNITLDVQ